MFPNQNKIKDNINKKTFKVQELTIAFCIESLNCIVLIERNSGQPREVMENYFKNDKCSEDVGHWSTIILKIKIKTLQKGAIMFSTHGPT